MSDEATDRIRTFLFDTQGFPRDNGLCVFVLVVVADERETAVSAVPVLVEFSRDVNFLHFTVQVMVFYAKQQETGRVSVRRT